MESVLENDFWTPPLLHVVHDEITKYLSYLILF